MRFGKYIRNLVGSDGGNDPDEEVRTQEVVDVSDVRPGMDIQGDVDQQLYVVDIRGKLSCRIVGYRCDRPGLQRAKPRPGIDGSPVIT